MKKALLQMNTAVLLWGFTGVLGRAIQLDAPVLVWYRMLLTAVFMAAILFYRNQWVAIEKKDRTQMVLVGCLMGIHWVAFYGSIKLANASIALVCLSTASIFTSVIDTLVHRRKFDYGELLIGAIALLGVFVMYLIPEIEKAYHHKTINDLLPHRNLGIASGVIAAFLSSIFTIMNKRIAGKYPACTMVFYEMGSGWILITLLLPIQFFYVPQTTLLPGVWDIVWLVVLSLCCTVWAQSLALSALKHLSSFTATLSVNLEPVYGVLLAFIFFKENEELTWAFYVGIGLICFSVLLQLVKMLRMHRAGAGYVQDRGGID